MQTTVNTQQMVWNSASEESFKQFLMDANLTDEVIQSLARPCVQQESIEFDSIV